MLVGIEIQGQYYITLADTLHITSHILVLLLPIATEYDGLLPCVLANMPILYDLVRSRLGP